MTDKLKPYKPGDYWSQDPSMRPIPPTSKDKAIAEVHATFAKAGLCIVPVDVLRRVWNETSDLLIANMVEPYLPKE